MFVNQSLNVKITKMVLDVPVSSHLKSYHDNCFTNFNPVFLVMIGKQYMAVKYVIEGSLFKLHF